MQKTILFLSHDAYRAGAQIALLRILEWLRVHHTRLRPVVVLKGGGELVEAYRALAPTYVLDAWVENEELSSGHRVDRIVKHHPVDLIYVNTIAALDHADKFKRAYHCPVILHVRELEMAISQFVGVETFRDAQRYVDGYVSSTIAGASNLVKNYNILRDRVHRLPFGIPLSAAPKSSPEDQDEIRRSLNIPTGSFIVGGSGDLHWWKSPDVFVRSGAIHGTGGDRSAGSLCLGWRPIGRPRVRPVGA